VRGGRREALLVTVGNSVGILAWALFAAVGVAAVVAASASLFTTIKLAGAIVLIVALDLVWYSALAYFVARTRRVFAQGPWLARAERLTGGVLVALGVRLALKRR
jgi:threonine/homoserine/homoserine lactone efflux protein